MKKLLFITFLLASMGTTAQEATNSTTQEVTDTIAQEANISIPDWFKNPPTSFRKFYGAGEGISMYLDIAEKKAMMSANLQLAEQVRPPKVKEIKSTTKRVDGSDDESIIHRTIVEAKLKGVTVINKSVVQRGNKYIVYVLVEMKK